MLSSYDPETRELTIIPDSSTFESALKFHSMYKKHIATSMDKITVDFREIPTIDSTCIGMLLNMQKMVRGRVVISLINLSPSVKRVMDICRMKKKFRIF